MMSFRSESPLTFVLMGVAALSVTVPVAVPLVAPLVNAAPGASGEFAAAGSKLRMTPALFEVPPGVNGPWMCPSVTFEVSPV